MIAEPQAYDVVVSLAGHDKGKLFIVTGARSDRLFLCDGKGKTLENPKCKSPKHVRIVTGGGAPASDKEIRQTLALAAKTAFAREERLLGER
jgi:hypothetical protein